MKTTKATIYIRGEFLGNMHKIEVNSVETRRGKYAQYLSAVFITFRKPRQRLDRGLVQGYEPSALILEGCGHPDPATPFRKVAEDASVVVSQSLYTSCDSRWQSDFDTMIGEYIATSGARVVADFRGVDTSEPVPVDGAGVGLSQ